MDTRLKMIDLFAGTGAFSMAFENTKKIEVVFANDFEKSSEHIYNLNLQHALTLVDICDVSVNSIPRHDILTGGFPCQPFSIAGKQDGFDDERSNVFWKIIEIIKYHTPRYVVLENVKNIISHDNKKTFQSIKKSISDIGYHMKYKILNTSTITGIPQNRERIFIVCFRDNPDFEKFTLDFESKPKADFRTFLETRKVEDKYYYTEKSKVWPLISKTVTQNDTVYQYRRVYVRENKNQECPTLTANMGSGGHNVPIIKDNFGIRKFTPRECFNLQGFPSDYKLGNLSDCKLYKLAGNAVSYPIVKLIADRLVNL